MLRRSAWNCSSISVIASLQNHTQHFSTSCWSPPCLTSFLTLTVAQQAERGTKHLKLMYPFFFNKRHIFCPFYIFFPFHWGHWGMSTNGEEMLPWLCTFECGSPSHRKAMVHVNSWQQQSREEKTLHERWGKRVMNCGIPPPLSAAHNWSYISVVVIKITICFNPMVHVNL